MNCPGLRPGTALTQLLPKHDLVVPTGGLLSSAKGVGRTGGARVGAVKNFTPPPPTILTAAGSWSTVDGQPWIPAGTPPRAGAVPWLCQESGSPDSACAPRCPSCTSLHPQGPSRIRSGHVPLSAVQPKERSTILLPWNPRPKQNVSQEGSPHTAGNDLEAPSKGTGPQTLGSTIHCVT